MSAGTLRHTLIVVHPQSFVPTALVAGSQVPEWARDLVATDDLVAALVADDEADTVEQVEPYKGATRADLKAEIESRNGTRVEADHVAPVSGKRDDLVAALVADDEAGLATLSD